MNYLERVCSYPDTKVEVKDVSVEELWQKRIDFAAPHKKDRAKEFYEIFLEMMENLNKGHKYTRRTMHRTKYWEYIRAYHKSWQEVPLQERAKRQMYRKFMDAVNLFHDIKKNGMLKPLDIIIENSKSSLYRGSRRLVVLKVLGTERAKVRYVVVTPIE